MRTEKHKRLVCMAADEYQVEGPDKIAKIDFAKCGIDVPP
jgi:hypothetical protein